MGEERALGRGMTIRPVTGALRPCPLRRRRADDVATAEIRNAPPVKWAAFVVAFNVAGTVAMRSEDRDARQVHQTFADGVTLAELEQHLARVSGLGVCDLRSGRAAGARFAG
jgi:hypothetical protein